MKIIIRLLIVFGLAVFFAIFSLTKSGHVMIFLGRYRVDLSLMMAVIIILTIYAIIYYLIRLWVNLHRLPNKIRRFRQSHALLTSRNYLNSAGINYFEGKYINAYKNALKSITKEINKDNRFLALMMAYKSAVYLQSKERQENLLEKLDEYQGKKWQLAKLMAIAETKYLNQEYGLCIDSLNQILDLDRRHMPGLQMLLKVFLELRNYDKAYVIYNSLLKQNSLALYQIDMYKYKIFSGIIESITDKGELINFYNKLEVVDKKNGIINKFYFDALVKLEEYSEAIHLIRDIDINNVGFSIGDNILVLSKRLANEKDAGELLLISEGCLMKNKNSSSLLLAVGILAYTLKLYSKSKNYVESSLMLKPTIDGYVYLTLIAKDTQSNDLADYAETKLLENIYKLK